MRFSSIFTLLALSNGIIAGPLVRIPSTQSTEDRVIRPDVLEAVITLCKNRDLFKYEFRGLDIVVTCDDNQLVTCRALFGACITSAGAMALLSFIGSPLADAAAIGSGGSALGSCQSGPSYCGNCFQRAKHYLGTCHDSPEIRMFIKDQISIAPNEQKTIENTNDISSSNSDESGQEYNQRASGSPGSDETKGKAGNSGSGDSNMDTIAMDQSTDEKLPTDGTTSGTNNVGTEDPLSDIGALAFDEPSKGNPEPSSISNNLGAKKTLSTNDGTLPLADQTS